MNNDEQFEQRLRRQALRQIPSDWRGEFLASVRKQVVAESKRAAKTPTLEHFRQLLAEIFRPNRRAWAGLAAIWVVILAVNLSIRDGSEMASSEKPPEPTPEIRELLRHQEQLFAELLGEETPDANRRRVTPQPRSSREPEIFTV